MAAAATSRLLSLLAEDDHALQVRLAAVLVCALAPAPLLRPFAPARARARPRPPSPPPPTQEHALRKLYDAIDTSWAESSEAVAQIEALAEDESMPADARHLAAAVGSKVGGGKGARMAAGVVSVACVLPVGAARTHTARAAAVQRRPPSFPPRSTTTSRSTARRCAWRWALGATLTLRATARSTLTRCWVRVGGSARGLGVLRECVRACVIARDARCLRPSS